MHVILTTFTQTTVKFHKYIGIYHLYLTALILFLIEFMFYQAFASSLTNGISLWSTSVGIIISENVKVIGKRFMRKWYRESNKRFTNLNSMGTKSASPFNNE